MQGSCCPWRVTQSSCQPDRPGLSTGRRGGGVEPHSALLPETQRVLGQGAWFGPGRLPQGRLGSGWVSAPGPGPHRRDSLGVRLASPGAWAGHQAGLSRGGQGDSVKWTLTTESPQHSFPAPGPQVGAGRVEGGFRVRAESCFRRGGFPQHFPTRLALGSNPGRALQTGRGPGHGSRGLDCWSARVPAAPAPPRPRPASAPPPEFPPSRVTFHSFRLSQQPSRQLSRSLWGSGWLSALLSRVSGAGQGGPAQS